MIESEEGQGRDLSALVVSRAGRLVATGDDREPYRVVGPDGGVVEPVSVFLRDLLASGKSAATLRSYAVDLLRVAVPGRGGCRVGPCVAGGGAGFQLLDPADGQAAAADVPAAGGALVIAVAGGAEPGDRQAVVR